MNLCFLMGTIINEVEFKFILNSKNISIAMFEIQLNNQSQIKVKAYNEMADKCYRKLVKKDKIIIQGELDSKMEIIINDFDYLL